MLLVYGVESILVGDIMCCMGLVSGMSEVEVFFLVSLFVVMIVYKEYCIMIV